MNEIVFLNKITQQDFESTTKISIDNVQFIFKI
jgi:hypothetical protein